MAVAQSISGRKPGYYKIIHPSTKQPVFFELKEILPNVNVAMWWLEKIDKINAPEKSDEIPKLGAPRDEKEAELLEFVLKRHTDYLSQTNSICNPKL